MVKLTKKLKIKNNTVYVDKTEQKISNEKKKLIQGTMYYRLCKEASNGIMDDLLKKVWTS